METPKISDNRIPLEQIPEGNHSIHRQKLPEQAETDAANGVCRPDWFQDGGTRKYMYENCTLFKMHRISGQNSYVEDVYITIPGVHYPTDINPSMPKAAAGTAPTAALRFIARPAAAHRLPDRCPEIRPPPAVS